MTTNEPYSVPLHTFIDANVLRGGLTTDVVLSLASAKLLRPRWSHRTLNEVRAHVPDAVADERIERRLAQAHSAFPRALVQGFEPRMGELPAHPGDQHILAATIHCGARVLLTQNLKDFWPQRDSIDVLPVDLSNFGRALLTRAPHQTFSALSRMVDRHVRSPRTLAEFVDKAVTIGELAPFARALNQALPAAERGRHPDLDRPVAPLSPAARLLAGLPPMSGALPPRPARGHARQASPHQPGHGRER